MVLGRLPTSNGQPAFIIDSDKIVTNCGGCLFLEAVINNEDLINYDSEKLVEASIYTERVSSGIDDETRSITLEDGSDHIHEADKSNTKFDSNEKLEVFESADVKTEMLKRTKKYRVDLLRSESLASLAPATLDRLFLRDYGIVVSIVPLSHSSILPRPTIIQTPKINKKLFFLYSKRTL